MKRSFLILVVFFINNLNAQTKSCNCQEILDKVIDKVKTNYIGYSLQNKSTDARFELKINGYKKLASKSRMENCHSLIQNFLDVFKDGHLFISENPNYSDSQLAKFKSEIISKKIKIESAYNYLVKNKNTLSALEGIWTDGLSKFALLKNFNSIKWGYQYIAIILDNPDKEKIGELKFGVNLNKNKFEGVYYNNKYGPRYVAIELSKLNSILNIWGGIVWGKMDFNSSYEIRSAPIYNPTLPKVTKIDRLSTLIEIPTFLLEKKKFDSILYANQKFICDAKNLLIDLRGNNGGNGIYWDLLSFYSDSTKSIFDGKGYAISSPDNIKYFENLAKYSTKNPYVSVVENMKLKGNVIVDGPKFESFQIAPLKSNIQKVIIFTDRSNKSAAESFILHSKQISNKVFTFGNNTGGVIDYNNINFVSLDCGSMGLSLGYPTYTRNKEILEKGFNMSGILPDVFIPPSKKDWVQFAKKYLAMTPPKYWPKKDTCKKL